MNLPEQLKEIMTLKQWVCHLNKVPKNPITGGNAMADKPATWGTFTEAVHAVERFSFSGIGFQFGLALDDTEAINTSRITGIDLDHVVHDDSSLEPFALEVVTLLDSYTELSPSGTGLHIFCKGKLPNIGRKKKLSNNCIIEIYNNRHILPLLEMFLAILSASKKELHNYRSYSRNISLNLRKKCRICLLSKRKLHIGGKLYQARQANTSLLTICLTRNY